MTSQPFHVYYLMSQLRAYSKDGNGKGQGSVVQVSLPRANYRKDETRQEGLDQNLKEEPKNKILL